MYDLDLIKGWYEKRWLTPVAPRIGGRFARALARLADRAVIGAGGGDQAAWRIPPL